jgi:uncharacterized membrane protein
MIMPEQTAPIDTGRLKESFRSAHLRVLLSALVGLIGGCLVGFILSWKYAPLVGWDIGSLTFLVWIWRSLRKLSAEQTAALALIEYPGRAGFDALLLLASTASLAAVGILFFQASHSSGITEILQVGLGITSVIISWAIAHTVYTLRYARVYYTNNGGIDFNNKLPPSYSDFAYLAFTIGMTFQVADTNLQTVELRKIVLKHALLSYLFGTVIVASTISLILGLGK